MRRDGRRARIFVNFDRVAGIQLHFSERERPCRLDSSSYLPILEALQYLKFASDHKHLQLFELNSVDARPSSPLARLRIPPNNNGSITTLRRCLRYRNADSKPCNSDI